LWCPVLAPNEASMAYLKECDPRHTYYELPCCEVHIDALQCDHLITIVVCQEIVYEPQVLCVFLILCHYPSTFDFAKLKFILFNKVVRS
jgi:hypothetical protein